MSWLTGWGEGAPAVSVAEPSAVAEPAPLAEAPAPASPTTSHGEVVELYAVGGGHYVVPGYEWLAGRQESDLNRQDAFLLRVPKPERRRYRSVVANWPEEWRERWGRLANELSDQGVEFPACEERAYDHVRREKQGA